MKAEQFSPRAVPEANGETPRLSAEVEPEPESKLKIVSNPQSVTRPTGSDESDTSASSSSSSASSDDSSSVSLDVAVRVLKPTAHNSGDILCCVALIFNF